MHRRKVLAAAALAPLVATSKAANACSIAVPPIGEGAGQVAALEILFGNWFRRDREAFLGGFTSGLSNEERAADLAARGALFERYFADEGNDHQLEAITIVDGHAFVAVLDYPAGGIGPDCSGMPTLRMFHVAFCGDKPLRIESIADAGSAGIGQVTHWSR